jgi:hypothetical protein
LRPSTILLALGAALGACANSGRPEMEEEFAEVRSNCGLRGTILERDPKDRKTLRLLFRQRNNAALQARRDGSLACAEHWARERGYRLNVGGL